MRLAWRVVNDLPALKSIDEEIKAMGSHYPIEVAVDAMRNANFYEGREDELRYFMFRYEEFLAEKLGLKYRNEQWNKIWLQSAARSISNTFGPKAKRLETSNIQLEIWCFYHRT